MSAVSENNIAEAIYLAVKDKSHTEQAQVLKNTAKFLAQKRLLSKAGKILSRLDKIANVDKGTVAAKIWSAEELSDSLKKRLTHSLLERYGGRHVAWEENLDEKLIGGYKIAVADEIIDVSIKSRMKQLQEHLTKN